MLRIFIDDDGSYLQWVKDNPLGLVLNTTRPPLPELLILHLASCQAVFGEPSLGNYWTADSIKVCADTREEIEEWAAKEVGGQVALCDLCNPDHST